MGSYEDTSWADLRALTRLRRVEAAGWHVPDHTIYYSSPSSGVPSKPVQARNEKAGREWKRAQWQAGNRTCLYCCRECKVQGPTTGPNSPELMTVDHYYPWSQGGADDETNWVVACRRCNEAKGDMMPGTFLRTLGFDAVSVPLAAYLTVDVGYVDGVSPTHAEAPFSPDHLHGVPSDHRQAGRAGGGGEGGLGGDGGGHPLGGDQEADQAGAPATGFDEVDQQGRRSVAV